MDEKQGDLGGRLPLGDSGERSVRTKLKICTQKARQLSLLQMLATTSSPCTVKAIP